MPALHHTTEKALGGDSLANCQSRSLRLTRYARPDLKEDIRKAYLEAVTQGQREAKPAEAALAWQRTLPGIHQFHACLEARLLLNMAGSVLENAGLGLDRYGAVPIPGSALKGCARRAALATLRQWCETNEKPSGNDRLPPAAEPFATQGDMLTAILRVFGCTDLEWQDWNTEKNQGNDLAWAGGNQWDALRTTARDALNAETQTPDETAPTRRGAITFLPAYPAKTPSPDLELDVLTPHHKKYYESKAPDAIALDNEDPVPVFFPAVAAGTTYTFTLAPIGHADATTLKHAATWLFTGLTIFGLGGKTAAGYGWFRNDTAETEKREALETERRQAAEAAATEEKRRAEERAARKAREATLASMTPEQKADAELAERAVDKGRLKEHLSKLKDLSADQKAAILRWFAAEGPGRDLWLNEIKTGKGKPKDAKVWKQIVGDIHAAKKNLKIDLP